MHAKSLVTCIAVAGRFLSAKQRQILREAVSDSGRPIFVYNGTALSDYTHGWLFVTEHEAVRCFQTTLTKARGIVKRAAA
jgi:hypothetical protein